MKQTDRKEKKTLADVNPMEPEALKKGIENLPPIIHDAIKDRLDEIPVYIQESFSPKNSITTACDD